MNAREFGLAVDAQYRLMLRPHKYDASEWANALSREAARVYLNSKSDKERLERAIANRGWDQQLQEALGSIAAIESAVSSAVFGGIVGMGAGAAAGLALGLLFAPLTGGMSLAAGSAFAASGSVYGTIAGFTKATQELADLFANASEPQKRHMIGELARLINTNYGADEILDYFLATDLLFVSPRTGCVTAVDIYAGSREERVHEKRAQIAYYNLRGVFSGARWGGHYVWWHQKEILPTLEDAMLLIASL